MSNPHQENEKSRHQEDLQGKQSGQQRNDRNPNQHSADATAGQAPQSNRESGNQGEFTGEHDTQLGSQSKAGTNRDESGTRTPPLEDNE